MIHRALVVAVIATTVAMPIASCLAQSREQNARLLGKYLTHRSVTALEWELTQFNLLWHGSFTGSTDYVTSFPVFFEPKTMRFHTSFRVQARREYQDPKPFFSLSRTERESILNGAVSHLVDLLGQSFPEVKNNPALLFVEFKFLSTGGSNSNVAVYENGRLVLVE